MLIPGKNILAEPEIVEVPRFETLLDQFKQRAIDYIGQGDPVMAVQVAETLENEAEVFTKLVEAATVMLQAERRHKNEQIKQMLAWWAEGSNLDARAADLGIERQQLSPGDPAAFPPVPAEYESDERLRLRYFLAPHAPAAGSRAHYRSEVLTLSDRARVSVEASNRGEVVVRYRFAPDEWAAQIKDGNGRQSAPGQVTVTVLSREGDGTPSAELIEAVRNHFARDDVCPITDEVIVQGAEILPYSIQARAYIYRGPDARLVKDEGERRLRQYADKLHVLGGQVDPGWVYHELHAAGAVKVDILGGFEGLAAADHQAPWCSSIAVEMVTL